MLPKVLKHIAVNQCVDGPNRIASFLANSNAVGSIILLFFCCYAPFLYLCAAKRVQVYLNLVGINRYSVSRTRVKQARQHGSIVKINRKNE